MSHRRLIFLGIWCALCLPGCGGSDEPQRHALRGSVVIEGTAVEKGTISFLPSPGNHAQPAHTSIEKGKYRFTKDNGPFSGAHRIVIGIKTTSDDEPMTAVGIKEAPAPRPTHDPPAPVPTKLKWEVEYTIPEEGDDRKDFDLGG